MFSVLAEGNRRYACATAIWKCGTTPGTTHASLQQVLSPRQWFARKDLAWDYPVSRSKVNAFIIIIKNNNRLVTQNLEPEQ